MFAGEEIPVHLVLGVAAALVQHPALTSVEPVTDDEGRGLRGGQEPGEATRVHGQRGTVAPQDVGELLVGDLEERHPLDDHLPAAHDALPHGSAYGHDRHWKPRMGKKIPASTAWRTPTTVSSASVSSSAVRSTSST